MAINIKDDTYAQPIKILNSKIPIVLEESAAHGILAGTGKKRPKLEYLPEGFHISTKQNENIEGVLHGFIDLFFECNGKYYILDWKSNFLGDTVDDYANNKLVGAMSDSNYHLQYIIYSLAIKKYLTSKEKLDFKNINSNLFSINLFDSLGKNIITNFSYIHNNQYTKTNFKDGYYIKQNYKRTYQFEKVWEVIAKSKDPNIGLELKKLITNRSTFFCNSCQN